MIDSDIFSDWQLNDRATDELICDAMGELNCSLPEEYLNFIRQYNGGAGFLGNSYLILWRIEELGRLNKEYEVNQYAPGLLVFGSSGGGEAYAFDRRTSAMKIVGIPFAGMDLDYLRNIADTFPEFIQQRKRDNDE